MCMLCNVVSLQSDRYVLYVFLNRTMMSRPVVSYLGVCWGGGGSEGRSI